ncbi:MAG: hypothetical protein ABIT96_09340, partial [Ferruginibacter sp.]
SVILLLGIYSLATMGFTLKEFYCCGKLKTVSVEMEAIATEKCSKDNSKSDDCCKNKYQVFKVNDNYVSASQVFLPPQFIVEVDIYFPSFQDNYSYSQQTKYSYQSHAPPLHNGVPVYLSNCVFTI